MLSEQGEPCGRAMRRGSRGGVGLEKRDELYYLFDEADMAAQRGVHDVFDPRDLANPGKVYPLPGRCAEVRRAMWDPRARLQGA